MSHSSSQIHLYVNAGSWRQEYSFQQLASVVATHQHFWNTLCSPHIWNDSETRILEMVGELFDATFV